jgi:hypothetical protein
MRAAKRASSDLGVLLGPEIALVIDPFFSNAALVVIAIGRSVRRGAVLGGGIRACGGHVSLGRRHGFGGIGARVAPRRMAR